MAVSLGKCLHELEASATEVWHRRQHEAARHHRPSCCMNSCRSCSSARSIQLAGSAPDQAMGLGLTRMCNLHRACSFKTGWSSISPQHGSGVAHRCGFVFGGPIDIAIARSDGRRAGNRRCRHRQRLPSTDELYRLLIVSVLAVSCSLVALQAADSRSL